MPRCQPGANNARVLCAAEQKDGAQKGGKPDTWVQDPKNATGQRPWGPKSVERGNKLFDEFYRQQGIVGDEAEWAVFIAAAYEPLPASFRIVNSQYKGVLNAQLAADPWGLEGLEIEDPTSPVPGTMFTVRAPKPIEWLPPGYAWIINAPRPIMRKCPALKSFHNWLIDENGQGKINRQEAVSMIPPMLLDVKPGHTVIDLCAAPGSKTAQLVDFLHAGQAHPRNCGLVLANDADTSRCYMLCHQLKRFSADSVMVTNHAAQMFPTLKTGRKEQVVVYGLFPYDPSCRNHARLRFYLYFI